MNFFGIFGIFGLFELIFLGGFFLLMVIGCTLDRRYDKEAPKWIVIGIALIIALVWYWNDFTFYNAEAGKPTLLQVVTSAAFWKPIGVYLLIGVGYSVLEFGLEVRRSARSYSSKWKTYLENKTHSTHYSSREQGKVGVPYKTLFNDAKTTQDEKSSEEHRQEHRVAYDLVNEFVNSNTRYSNKEVIISIEKGNDNLSIEPTINKSALTHWLAAWITLWPFYAVSLIIGDLLTEVCRVLADFFTHLSGRFVRMSFSNVFKF